MKFRSLTEADIECRVQQVKPNGLSLLLYKNARVDMAILDETVGAENWQREHYECKGNLFCRVGICCKMNIDESGNNGDILSPSWVWKSDCGAESNTEAEKGEASDSFKRACVNWGIGRELYTKINIVVQMKTQKNANGKFEPVDSNDKWARFTVAEMEVHGEQITYLTVADKNGNIVFSYGQPGEPVEDITATCDRCGRNITPIMKKDGSIWPVREIVPYTEKMFGRHLCGPCMKAAKEAEKNGA